MPEEEKRYEYPKTRDPILIPVDDKSTLSVQHSKVIRKEDQRVFEDVQLCRMIVGRNGTFVPRINGRVGLPPEMKTEHFQELAKAYQEMKKELGKNE